MGALLLALLVLAVAAGVTAEADLRLARWVQSFRHPALDVPMVAVSQVGFFFPFAYIALALALFAGLRWGRARGIAVLLCVGGAYAVGTALKELVARPRPTLAEVWVYQPLGEHAFPSNHVLTFAALFGSLTYLAWTAGRRDRLRWPITLASGWAIALVGPSRVYLGAHWPTDVVAGYLLAALWLWIVLSAWWCREGVAHRREVLGSPEPEGSESSSR